MAKKTKPSRSPRNPALITGQVVKWARERIGRSQEEIAEEIGSGIRAGNIDDWEKEKARPDFGYAQKLAVALHIPFGYLFLPEPPANDIQVPDLRTVGSKPIEELSANLLDQLRNLLLKQEWYRDYAEKQGWRPLGFIGRFSIRSKFDDVAADMRNELGIDEEFRRACSNWEGFLSNFMAKAEAMGVLVIRSGVVGSATVRPLSVKEFRGFVISDAIAPLVFINGKDSTSAQVFTLAHELAHLWIGKSGVSNPKPKKRSSDEVNEVERFCNRVAAEVLVPSSAFVRLWRDNTTTDSNVQALVRHFRVSSHVILRQAFEHDKFSREEYSRLVQAEEDRFKEKEKATGGSFYRNIKIRNSRILTESVLDAIQEKSVGLRDAATLLGCKVPTLKNIASELR